MNRIVVGFLLVPLVLPLTLLVRGGMENLTGALWVAGVTALLTTGLGVPAFLLFRRRRWLKAWQVVGGGALLGAARAHPGTYRSIEAALVFVPAYAVLAAAHASLFWLIAVWRNASLDARPVAAPDA